MFDEGVLELVKSRPVHSIVYIAGATCSGKTTLVDWLRSRLEGTQVVSMDNYLRDLNDPKLPPRGGRYPVFDNPEAYHMDELAGDLRRLLAGEDVEMPIYGTIENRRLAGRVTVPGKASYYLVEGPYAFYLSFVKKEIVLARSSRVFDAGIEGLKIFVTADKQVLHDRRFARDRKLYPVMVSDENIERNLELIARATDDLIILPQQCEADLVVMTT